MAKKIAILGGGVGAMATAFELTSQPNWQEEYEITVYQLGWRLGGKGASGRNALMHDRIEEHGLHMWFGFYENAFAVMRLLYQEIHDKNLAPGSPFQDCFDAFKRQTRITQFENVDGEWKIWSVNFPVLPGLPGDDVLNTGNMPPQPWEYVLKILEFLENEYERVVHERLAAASTQRKPEWIRVVNQFMSDVEIEEGKTPLHLAHIYASRMDRNAREHKSAETDLLNALLEHFREWLFAVAKTLLDASDDVRRLLIAVDLGLAIIRGLIADDVIRQGFGVIDKYDAAEWLARNGCLQPMNPLMRSLYDGCFAYAGSDPNRPRFSAASAMNGMLRLLFTYKGSIVWRMAAGMGDTIFGAFYLVLKHRGVKFEFFQRVKKLSVSGDEIDSIDIDVQATLKAGEYQPLVYVKGLPCWPNQPLYDQLNEGDQIKGYNLESAYTPWHDKLRGRTLHRGEHFDQVVLGISLGALPFICQDLIAANPRWNAMVANMETNQTKGLQLWLHASAAQLGWDGGVNYPDEQRAVATAFEEASYDTYCDFSHLITMEGWIPADNVQQIAYFCNCIPNPAVEPPPFTDPNFPATQYAIGRQQTLAFLDGHLAPIWPKGVDANGALQWDLLVAPPDQHGPDRLASQHMSVNLDPSERYVTALPGTATWRLPSGASGFTNLVLAGDWTLTDLNGGCVEAAVMSGKMACEAITGKTVRIYTAFCGILPEVKGTGA